MTGVYDCNGFRACRFLTSWPAFKFLHRSSSCIRCGVLIAVAQEQKKFEPTLRFSRVPGQSGFGEFCTFSRCFAV